MKLKRPTLALLTIVLICLAAIPLWVAFAMDDSQRIRDITQSGVTLRVYDNSESLSQIYALNDQGHVLGLRETMNEQGTIYTQLCFYSNGQKTFDISALEGFTNQELLALSEVGTACGYASRAPGTSGGSLVPVLWDSKTKETIRLPTLDSDVTGQAHSISADGKRIAGYSSGAEPEQHLVPCVWDWDEKEEKWTCLKLDTIELFNPFVFSSRVVLSADGNTIASCPTEAFLENGLIDSSLMVWKWAEGTWTRTQICDDQMRLHDINNRGELVGDISTQQGGRQPVFVSADGEVQLIEVLDGDRGGIAWGINEEGMVVGQSDDPPGPDGGPVAFQWSKGKTTPLPMPEKSVFSMAMDINNEGIIAGMADITFPETVEDPATGKEEPLVKALGFLRLPD